METSSTSLASEAKAEKILKAQTLETSTESFNGDEVSIAINEMRRSVKLSTHGLLAVLDYDDSCEITAAMVPEVIEDHRGFLDVANMTFNKTQNTFIALLEREESLKAQCVEDRRAIYLMTRLHHGLEQLLKLQSPFNLYEKEINKDTVAIALLQRCLLEIHKQHEQYKTLCAVAGEATELEELTNIIKKIVRALTELIDTMILSQRSKVRCLDLLKSAR